METRRSFNAKLLGSVMAYGLIETLYGRELLGQSVRPIIHQWMLELQELCQDLKGQKLKDVDFQARLEALYRRVDLPELVKLIDFDRLAADLKYPHKGAASKGLDVSKIEGMPGPEKIAFGRQIFACQKDRSIVPHGHDNMCTGFIVLKGDWHGRHYDRVEDNKDHYLIRPTIDRTFKPGECSSVSDHKDNVHWFKAASDVAFVFNIHVLGYNPENKKSISRVYVDPEGERVSGGLIKAAKMTSKDCHEKYG